MLGRVGTDGTYSYSMCGGMHARDLSTGQQQINGKLIELKLSNDRSHSRVILGHSRLILPGSMMDERKKNNLIRIGKWICMVVVVALS
jgi:hypothetical protein